MSKNKNFSKLTWTYITTLLLSLTIILMGLVIVIPTSAIPMTTFGQLANGNLSTNQSAYMNSFCYGQLNGSSTGFIGFDNTSLFYTTGTTTNKLTNTSAQLSGTGETMFTSGVLAPALPNGTCIDVQYIPEMNFGGVGVDGYARIGYQSPGAQRCGSAGDNSCGGSVGTDASIGTLSLFTGGAITGTGANWTKGLQVNMTLCKNATGTEIYYWNNNTYRTVVTDFPILVTNFSARLELSASKINLTWVCAWNSSLGAPGLSAIDTTPPVINITNLNASSNTSFGKNLNISAFITGSPTSVNFTFNLTGNKALYNFTYSVSGVNVWISQNITVNLTKNSVINASVVACDSSNNCAINSTIITVGNNVPTPTILLPTVNNYNTTLTNYFFNITYSADGDGDLITTVRYYINGLLNQSISISGGNTGNTTFNASDGYYILNVSLFDGTSWGANVTTNFTLDSTNPLIDIFNITNNTVFRRINATLLIQVSDLNIYNLTFNLRNSSNDMIQTAANSTTNAGTTLRLQVALNLTQLADGNYTIDVNFSDTHTRNAIPDYRYKELIDGFDFRTPEGNDITITEVGVSGNLFQRILVILWGNPSILATKITDRYILEFGEEKLRKSKQFVVKSNNPIDIINSKYKGHIVVRNGMNGNWVDFENNDANSTVTLQRISQNEVVATVISKSFNFKSIGGLNVVNRFYTIQVDNSPPYFPQSSQNASVVGTDGVIGVSFTCADLIGLSTCIIGHNNTGTWGNITNTTMPNNTTNSYNLSYNLSITAIQGATIGFMASANDTGNFFASSLTLTVLVNDTTNPIINGSINSSRFTTNQSINASFNVSDNTGLNYGQVIFTEEGITYYYNFSLSGTSRSFAQNFTIKTQNGVINITGLVNDSYGNLKQNLTSAPITKDLTVKAVNTYGNSTILSFSAMIYNSTDSVNKSTVNGSLDFLDVMMGNYSFNFSSSENEGYFNLTEIKQTVLNDTRLLTFNAYQAIIYISSKRRGTNISIIDYNVSTRLASNISNSSGETRLYLNASRKYNISGYSASYFDNYIETDIINNLSINNVILRLYNVNLTVNAYSAINSTNLNNFIVYLKGNNTDYSENLSSGTNNNVTFSLGNGTYNITIDVPSYSLMKARFTLLSNDTFQNKTFVIAGLNSINFSVFDEFLNSLMQNTSVNVQIIGNVLTVNKTIVNGTGYFQDLAEDEYRIRYSADGFNIRDYYFNIVNSTNATTKLYLLSTGNSTNIVFTVLDEKSNNFPNVTIKALRYFSPTGYEVVVMGKTEATGRTQINLQQNNPFYKVLVTDTKGNILLDTIPSTIFATSYTLRVTTVEDNLIPIRNRGLVFNNLSFSNISNSFVFTYNEQFGISTEACMVVDELSLNYGQKQVCKSCSTSATASLVCAVNDSYTANRTLVAKAYLLKTEESNSTVILLDELTLVSQQIVDKTKNIFGLSGVLVGFIIFITMVFVGSWNPVVSMVLGTTGFIATYSMGFITLGSAGLQWIVSIVILTGILMYRSKA